MSKVSVLSPEEIKKQQEYAFKVKNILSERRTNHKYFIMTFGCQLNENDSEKIAGMLSDMGFEEGESADESSLILFNTCCVREHAEEKVYGHLGALKKRHTQDPDFIIAVCGCMVQQPSVQEEIKKKYGHVDLVFGTHNSYRLPELLYNVIAEKKNIIEVWESAGLIAEGIPIKREASCKAWLTAMYGCNNFCTYCIVPYVRGRERSRKPEAIVKEAELLVSEGVKEITVLGQNVNSYCGINDKDEELNFSQLLTMLENVEGLERIRFMTSHPKDLSEDLIDTIARSRKVCSQLHLPIQSGSSRLLKLMNRKYTKENYLDLIGKIKAKVPNISLTTDIIVGFPGETEEDFEETLDVVRKVRYDSAYTFLYSKRKGTPAAEWDEQIPDEIKKERFDRLLKLQNSISREINETYLNSTVEVLCEGYSKNNVSKLTGRTDGNKIVNFSGTEDMIGKLIKVKIDNIQTWSLDGTVVV